MKYESINSQLFIENRQKFVPNLKSKSIAIFNSNDLMPRNGDNPFPFRQNSDLFYLTGIDQEETTLILFPDSPVEKYKEVLFIRETNENIAVWEGEKLTKEEAQKASGIKTVLWSGQLETILKMLMIQAEHCYLNTNENDRASFAIPDKDNRFIAQIKSMFPLHHYERSAPIISDLRTLKSDIEIELLKKACVITDKTFRRVLQFVRPGVMEYEVEAEIMHEFLRNGATTYAYYPIVASGKNSCILHYVNNNKECKDGDILLMDFGAEYANYAADMTRTIPVNGKYSSRQRAVYDAVLRVMKKATQILRPGIVLDDYNKEVGNIMESELIGLGLLDKKEVEKQDPDKPLYKKYFMHGTSHFLGLDVHDVGNRYKPIQAGMVFTCEPGIYIREEGLGVRIENDILVTEGDPIDLMADIPVEAEEIEEIMHS